MTSKVQICNMALNTLGANPITALTDNTEEGKLCNTFFDTLADRAMMQGSWTSTIVRTSLAQTTNTPSFGYANEFQLPVDPKCLKVLNVNECVAGDKDFKIEGDKLLSDDDTISIRYIARLTDTEDWDPLLVEAMEALLISYLAKPLTAASEDKVRALREGYFQLVNRNLALDGQQGSKDTIVSNSLIDVRP